MSETLEAALPEHLDAQAERLMHRLCDRKLRIATAESCTGGMLASLLTDVPGVSGSFERGFVVYSEPAKCELLGLRPEDIDRFGVVSPEVAVAMAEGALRHSRADVAVSTTGYADEGEEPGLVHFACAVRGGPTNHRAERFGAIGRGPVRIACMRVALTMLDEVI